MNSCIQSNKNNAYVTKEIRYEGKTDGDMIMRRAFRKSASKK